MKALLAALSIVLPLAASAVEDWHSALHYNGRSASVQVLPSGYQLSSDGETQWLPRQTASSTTASPLFDALFALAQIELDRARVATIADAAFAHGQPLSCVCLQTGEKWNYVWTRDLAYATDLALFRFDPQRARNGLEFKLSRLRPALAASMEQSAAASYVVQDTGSGGSWPVSTDRIVWFLGARQLLDDHDFSDKVYKALKDTLAQDREHVFDGERGLYRGETSFLDWREQSYPAWSAQDVGFIAASFALSTNVLYWQAIDLAARLAAERHDPAAAIYRQQAEALGIAIERTFWREDRGLYQSYSGGINAPQRIEAYDLLGTALLVLSGIAEPAHARRALANYPTWDAGSPVIWPEREDVPIYHNRAIWPFVSAYALKAARALNQPERIAHELRSILRAAALAGSNRENYEFTSAAVHVDDGARSGPAVNSKRQLWSVAAYLDLVVEGVFGVTDHGMIEPKIPRELLPLLFGEGATIRLDMPPLHLILIRPAHIAADANLLVADPVRTELLHGDGGETRVQLRAVHVAPNPLPQDRAIYAPPTPAPLQVSRDGALWQIRSNASVPLRLSVNGRYLRSFRNTTTLPQRREQQCLSATASDRQGIESLPSASVCVGDHERVEGAWPRYWRATQSGRYLLRLEYRNAHGPINTGITAAEKMLRVQCADEPAQRVPIVMPHSIGWQASTAVAFSASVGQDCRFNLEQGFNMSELQHYASYTGGAGGADGAINAADYGALQISTRD